MATPIGIRVVDDFGNQRSVTYYSSGATIADLETDANNAAAALNAVSGVGVVSAQATVPLDVSGNTSTPDAGSFYGAGATFAIKTNQDPPQSWTHYVPDIGAAAFAGNEVDVDEASVAGYLAAIANPALGTVWVDEDDNQLEITGTTGIRATRKTR